SSFAGCSCSKASRNTCNASRSSRPTDLDSKLAAHVAERALSAKNCAGFRSWYTFGEQSARGFFKSGKVERNRLNLDGVEQRDKHFFRTPFLRGTEAVRGLFQPDDQNAGGPDVGPAGGHRRR